MAISIPQPKDKVREIIGRVASVLVKFSGLYPTLETIDNTVPDYAFWDKFRRGKQKGYEFSGLFVKPITQIMTAWVLGKGVQAHLAEAAPRAEDGVEDENHPITYTNELLQRFLRRIHAVLTQVVEDLYALGDQYIVVNPDGSISIPSPETVQADYDPLDYRTLVKATITTKTEKATITDEYRLDGRTIVIKWADITQPEQHFDFPNLIGMLPIIHFANERGSNETHGRPTAEALLDTLDKYNDMTEKGIGGTELMSNPFPVIEGAEDTDEVLAQNGELVTEMDSQGNAVQRWYINFKRLTMLVIGKGGAFRLVTPPAGFTEDLRKMLKLLFLLILDYTRIPEVIWGNEMSSSRASAAEQMTTFYQHVEARRVALEGEGADDLLQAEARGGMFQLIDVWLRIKRLTDRRVVVAPTVLLWPELNQKADDMRLKWTEFLRKESLMPDEEAVRQSGLVEDVAATVEKARLEAEERKDEFDQAVDNEINRQEADEETDEEPEPEAEAA